jgi:hypothetical protein
MHEQNNKLHSEIALAIKGAKKQMFRRHREGMSIREAADKFCVDMANRFEPLCKAEKPADPVCDCTQAEIEDDEKTRVVRALSELLHNPQTPSDLYQECAEFVCNANNSMEEKKNTLHSEPSLAMLLDAIPAEESMGAVWRAREETVVRDRMRAKGAGGAQ